MSSSRSTTCARPVTSPSCAATSGSTLPDPTLLEGTAARLAAARAEAASRLASAQAELADVIGSASSTTGDDEHDPEGATIGFERAQASSFVQRARDQLTEVDEALVRLRDGTYGRCIRCGTEIGAERLAARPATPVCIRCAAARRAS